MTFKIVPKEIKKRNQDRNFIVCRIREKQRSTGNIQIFNSGSDTFTEFDKIHAHLSLVNKNAELLNSGVQVDLPGICEGLLAQLIL